MEAPIVRGVLTESSKADGLSHVVEMAPAHLAIVDET